MRVIAGRFGSVCVAELKVFSAVTPSEESASSLFAWACAVPTAVMNSGVVVELDGSQRMSDTVDCVEL